MPIDLLGAFFPPPVRLDPDRPQRVDKTDRDGRPGHKPEPRGKRRRASSEPEETEDGEHQISVEA